MAGDVVSRKKCAVDGCEDASSKRGWCDFHYGRWLDHGDPLAGGPRRRKPGTMPKICVVDGCSKKAVALDVCSMHYIRLKKHGDVHGGVFHQDGRSKQWHVRQGRSAHGYVVRFDRKSPHANKVSGIVLQHREVMGEHIGRPLSSNESVHHKNGVRTDNRIENLELWVKGQPAGQKVADQVEWARKILANYGDLVDKML